MSWEENDKTIQSGYKTAEFQKDTLRTVTLNEKDAIQAVIGKPVNQDSFEIASYIFSKDHGWTVQKAKDWYSQFHGAKEHLLALLPFSIAEKVVDKPLKIRGLAMTAGMSRNLNIYTPQELEAFSGKLVDAPVYLEHVSAQDAVGKVTKTDWDGQNLFYEAEIFDDETAQKIRKGLICHVSVGADYQTLDLVNGKVPHGLFNPELSLVAVPGITETNIQIQEKLRLQEQEYQTAPAQDVTEALIKKSTEPTIPISQAIKLIEQVMPNNHVQRSWSLGPQRMCQELNRALFKLRGMQDSHRIDRQ